MIKDKWGSSDLVQCLLYLFLVLFLFCYLCFVFHDNNANYQNFSENERQLVFFEKHVRPLIDRALAQGINVTIVAYGETGSGKSYTMDGNINFLGNNNAPKTSRDEHPKQQPME